MKGSLLPASIEVLTGPDKEAWSIGRIPPWAVAFPRSEGEVQQLFALASEQKWNVAPAGLGRWLGAGAPGPVDLVVSTRNMAKVVHYEPADLTLTIAAGATHEDIEGVTSPNGQWLPLDPPGGGTIGGTVATGSAGPLRASFGTPRDLVLGVRLVTPEGQALRLGGGVVKNVAGYDLLKAVIGSRGTLGLITEVTTRLHPIPEWDRTLVYRRSEWGEALRIARAVAGTRVVLDALELLLHPEPTVLVRIMATEESGSEVARLVVAEVGMEADRVLDATETRETFAGLAAEGAVRPGLSLRASARPSRLGELLALAAPLLERAGDRGKGAVHVTEGVLRFDVRPALSPREDGAANPLNAAVWLPLLGAFREAVGAIGGSVVILEGPRDLFANLSPWDTPSTCVQGLQEGIRQAFDGARVLWGGTQ